MALALLLALPSATADAGQGGAMPPVTAEEALARYRQAFQSTRELDCPRGGDPNDIVVCARPKDAPDPNRAPLPVPREPGARVAGEPMADGGGCHRLCPQPLKVDLIGAAKFMKNLAERLIEGE
jgi:hypothetical protein